MSHCTCDYHQEQNKTDYSHAHLIPSHSNEGQLGEEELEKLFEEFTKESYWGLEGSSESEKRALEIKAEIFDLIRKKMV